MYPLQLKEGIRLSESEIPAGLDSIYLMGNLLARMHRGGILVEGMNFTFSSAKGHWMISDWAKVQTDVALDPQKMSRQLIDLIPGKETKEPVLLAMLGGYAQEAYRIIDPVHAGFTDAVIGQLVNGPLLSAPKPQEAVLDLEKVLACSGSRVVFTGEAPRLETVGDPWQNGEVTDKDILFAATVFILAGMHVTHWLQQLERMYPGRETISLLNALNAKAHLQQRTYSGLIPRLFGAESNGIAGRIRKQPLPERNLFTLIGKVYAEASLPKTNLSESLDLLAQLKRNTDELPPKERLSCLNAVVDGFYSLALAADAQSQAVDSMQLAQAAQMVLQWLSGTWEGAENRLLRAEYHFNQYAWRTLPDEKRSDQNTLFTYAGFAGSASLTDLRYFLLSREQFKHKRISNHLWSAVWRAIERQRGVIKMLWRHYADRDSGQHPHLELVLKHTLKQYLSGLKQHYSAVVATIEQDCPSTWVRCWGQDGEAGTEFIMHREMTQGIALLEALEKKGLDNTSGELLRELALLTAAQ